MDFHTHANPTFWHQKLIKKQDTPLPSPQEKLGIVHPLVDEVGGDRLRAVGELHVVHSVHKQGGVVVQSSNGHLQTDGSQLVGLHPPHQALQGRLHKEGDDLQTRKQTSR